MKKTSAELLNESKKSISKILETGNTLGQEFISNGWADSKEEVKDIIDIQDDVARVIEDNWDKPFQSSKPFEQEFYHDGYTQSTNPDTLEGTAYDMGGFILVCADYNEAYGSKGIFAANIYKGMDIDAAIKQNKIDVWGGDDFGGDDEIEDDLF